MDYLKILKDSWWVPFNFPLGVIWKKLKVIVDGKRCSVDLLQFSKLSSLSCIINLMKYFVYIF